MGFPLYFKDLSLKNSSNRNLIINFLEQNYKKDIVSIDYWNYRLILDSFSKNKNYNYEISYINLLQLTKNNEIKQLDLRKYFIKNFTIFRKETKELIIKHF